MAEISKDHQEKIQKMQLLEQNLQNLLNQRQQFEQQLAEIESALNESSDSKNTYKIIGNIMVSVDKNSLKKELNDKKEVLTLRIKAIEKQEEIMREKAKKLQEEVLSNIKGKK
ncbi:MAG: prefoldin subunit beta [Candidatus Woesearchaeota archaeon]